MPAKALAGPASYSGGHLVLVGDVENRREVWIRPSLDYIPRRITSGTIFPTIIQVKSILLKFGEADSTDRPSGTTPRLPSIARP
jgi:hypothetical protein